jgi:hypothetical protein
MTRIFNRRRVRVDHSWVAGGRDGFSNHPQQYGGPQHLLVPALVGAGSKPTRSSTASQYLHILATVLTHKQIIALIRRRTLQEQPRHCIIN